LEVQDPTKVCVFPDLAELLLNYEPFKHEDDVALFNYLTMQVLLKELMNRDKSDE
jgi:hypothetical protein